MKVKFVPQNIELEISSTESVKELADRNGIFIKSICNGLPSCSECRVRVVEGDHNILPPNAKELNLIGSGYFIDQRRLACQIHCFGDVTIDLSEQIEKQKQQSARRPQGSKKAETEVTHAVSGNLIQQEDTLFKEVRDQVPAQPQRDNRQQNQSHQKPHHQDRGSNQRRGHGGSQQGGRDSQHGGSQQGGRDSQHGRRDGHRGGSDSNRGGGANQRGGDSKNSNQRGSSDSRGSSEQQGGSRNHRHRQGRFKR